MTKIISQCSMLKSDDFNLKDKSDGHKLCLNCDHGLKEDIRHIIMQCPFTIQEKGAMFEEIYTIPDG